MVLGRVSLLTCLFVCVFFVQSAVCGPAPDRAEQIIPSPTLSVTEPPMMVPSPPPAQTSPVEEPASPLSGFDVKTGFGTVAASGSAATSPAFKVSNYGIESGWVQVNRISSPEFFGYGLRALGSFSYQQYFGSTGNFPVTVPGNQMPNQGDDIDSQLDVEMWSVDVEMDLTKVNFGKNSMFGCGGPFRYGPRLQWFNYSETLRVENETQNYSRSDTLVWDMFGLGLFGEIHLAQIGAKGIPLISEFNPVIKMAFIAGKGESARYVNTEFVLSLAVPFSKDSLIDRSSMIAGYVPNFSLTGQIGYSKWVVSETRDPYSGVPTFPDANTDFSFDGFIAGIGIGF